MATICCTAMEQLDSCCVGAADKICEQGQEHGTVEKLGDGVRSLTDGPIDDDHAAA